MDKQKQIEEIAKVVEDTMFEYRGFCVNKNSCDCDAKTNCVACNIAHNVYNAGYRKVCEPAIKNGEVVGFVNGADYVPKNLFLFGLSRARKETAEKFAERLKEQLEENSPIAGYDLEDLEFDGETIQECIDEICKELTGGERND